jgi:hypothetical protein
MLESTNQLVRNLCEQTVFLSPKLQKKEEQ